MHAHCHPPLCCSLAQSVETALKSEDSLVALYEFLQVNIQQLAELTRLVRGDLSPLHRRILAALITIDVHARDIVADLHKRGTKVGRGRTYRARGPSALVGAGF